MAVATFGSKWQADVFTLQRGLFDVAPFIKLREAFEMGAWYTEMNRKDKK